MSGPMVLALVVLALFLISLVRVGGELEYGESGLRVRVRLGRIRVTVYPMKPRKKRERPPEKRKTPPPERKPVEKPQGGNTWELLQALLPVVSEAAGRLKRKIRVDRLDMDLVVAAGDPAAAAFAYGAANAALGMLIPILENNFRIKERNLRTKCDFDRKAPSVRLWTAFSLTVGQGTALTFFLGLRALKVFMQHRKVERKEAV